MPKSLVLGNGSMMVGLDNHGYIRDFYFPFVGLDNHLGGFYFHKIGVWVENDPPAGGFSWLHDGGWHISVDCMKETLVGETEVMHERLGIKLQFHDVVYNEKNIFIRQVTVSNQTGRKRLIKLFFNQEFQIYGSKLGDTAYYDPMRNVIIHYKGRRVFLINAKVGEQGFDDYSIGIFGLEGKEGTFKDAEDGYLSKNPIEHGSVDSVIGLSFPLEGSESRVADYWIISAKSIREAHEVNKYTIQKTPEHFIKTTTDFWHAWVNKENFNFFELSPRVVDVFKKSLLIMRTHADNNGSIIASGDSDMLQHGRDTYSYMWPRDAAFAALAFDKAGDLTVARRFFELCNRLVSDEGYFLHKFRPDESLGSSWHPWVRNGRVALPIQEDETALVIYALWKHYEVSRDLEFVESIYNSLIKRASDFMLSFRVKESGLPQPSYDLWEEKFGISTFTSASVYGALLAAGRFAKLLGKREAEEEYNKAAFEIKDAILKYLYNKGDGSYYKMINFQENEISYDTTFDASSVYGIYKFGVLGVNDKQLVNAMKLVEARLLCKTPVSGVVRYEGDMYYRVGGETPGNPWIITTLWLVQYYIARAVEKSDFEIVRKWLSWVADRALESGILSEQLNPYTGEQISASPLTWSQAEFVVTVLEYLERLEQLGISKVKI